MMRIVNELFKQKAEAEWTRHSLVKNVRMKVILCLAIFVFAQVFWMNF